MKDVIREVELYRPDLDRVEVLAGEACAFGYRDSVFKRELRGRAIILSVTFALDLNPVFRLGYGDLNAKVAEAGGPTLRRVPRCGGRDSPQQASRSAGAGQRRQLFQVIPWCRASLRCVCANAVPTAPFLRRGCGRVKLAAGWLIDRAGWKGKREGCVGMHQRQALVLVNYGGASGSEVLALARRVQQEVRERFGVDIEMEVNVL
ncbi:MAG: hypothetical protein ACLTZY_09440 [Alistipes indistinctus]